MSESCALIWKEWAEARIYLWIAWSVFIGLPIIGGIEEKLQYGKPVSFFMSPFIIVSGAAFAVVVGVAGSCRDLQDGVHAFWQSRPLTATKLFSFKLIAGAIVVLSATLLPLVIEFRIESAKGSAVAGMWMQCLFIAVFATAFAAGCLLRRVAYAAAVATVGAILIYVVPLVVPTLARFNAGVVLDLVDAGNWRENSFFGAARFEFAAGMLVWGAVMGVFGVLAVRRDWHIESSTPLIYAAITTAFTLLLASASYQLGTNLPVLDRVSLLSGETVMEIRPENELVDVYTHRPEERDIVPRAGSQIYYRTYRRQVKIEGNRLKVGAPELVLNGAEWVDRTPWYARNPADPTIYYHVGFDNESRQQQLVVKKENPKTYELTQLSPPMELMPGSLEDQRVAFVFVWRQTLFVYGTRLITLDISDPAHPRKVAETDFPRDQLRSQPLTGNIATVLLPPFPGVPAMERLKCAIERSYYASVFDGLYWAEIFKEKNDFTLNAFKLISLTDTKATFHKIGTFHPTLIESVLGPLQYGQLSLANGILYADAPFGGAGVIDLTRGGMSLIAHFASPGMTRCVALDDGRAIAGGTDLELLGSPPKR